MTSRLAATCLCPHADHLRSPSGGARPSQAGFGGVEAYPDFATKAAVLCWHLVRNHPPPDGNRRCAFLATVEFVERNGRTWNPAAPERAWRGIGRILRGGREEQRD
jgi:hypothetical protein